MEILLLIIGLAFVLYFLTMSICAVVKKSKNIKFYIIGFAIAILVTFIGYIQIPIYSTGSVSAENKGNGSSGVKTTESQNISSDIAEKILKVNFIDNGYNGCILIQNGTQNTLIDSGKKENVKAIEKSLKVHSIKRIYSIIITSGDDTTMGAAASIIKDYNVEDARYVDDSVKGNSYFSEIQSAINANGGEFNKINFTYKSDGVSVTGSCSVNGTKLNFQIQKNQSKLNAMTFVKDEFDKKLNTAGIQHSVDTNCDSEGNFNVEISTYKK